MANGHQFYIRTVKDHEQQRKLQPDPQVKILPISVGKTNLILVITGFLGWRTLLQKAISSVNSVEVRVGWVQSSFKFAQSRITNNKENFNTPASKNSSN